MGAGAAKNESRQVVNISAEVFNSCPRVSAVNSIDLNGVQFLPNDLCYGPGLPKPKFSIDQTAGVEAECIISAMQNIISKTVAEQDAKTQNGLGFVFSENASDIETQLKTRMENDCSSASSENAASVSDTIVTACDWRFVQNASVKSSCIINSLQDLANDISLKQKADAKGASLADLLGGENMIIILVIVAVIIIVIVVAIIVVKMKKLPKPNESIELQDFSTQPVMPPEAQTGIPEPLQQNGGEVPLKKNVSPKWTSSSSFLEKNKHLRRIRKESGGYSVVIVCVVLFLLLLLVSVPKHYQQSLKNNNHDYHLIAVPETEEKS